MRYSTAIDKLLSLTDLERVAGRAPHARRYDLGRMRLLLDRLGAPHLRIPTVHITGTKGKGSIAALMASALCAQGYQPGLFTSPHLHTFRERIQFDGSAVSEEEFAALVDEIWPVLEGVSREGPYGPVTTFELLTAMAFLYYARKGAGFQVIEVGLGGTLDSTNLVQPQLCVFSSISLDHTGILGDTVEKIARDKAGIIKPGCVVVSSPQEPGVLRILQEASRDNGATFVPVAEECRWTLESHDLGGQSFTLSAGWGEFPLRMSLLGEHQLENAATALTSLQVLSELGFTVTRDSIARGFRSVWWPARMEVLSKSPLLLVDGAHNPYSAGKLREALHRYFEFSRLRYVVGLSSDKNIEGIVRALAQDGPEVMATRSRHPRAASTQTLSREFLREGVEVMQIDGVRDAMQHALASARSGDLLVVTGSLFVAAEAREFYLDIPPELYPRLDTRTSVP